MATATIETIEERLVTLETRLDALQEQAPDCLPLTAPSKPKRGWKAIVGAFADDPLYDEAMRLGREWRESQFDEADAKVF